MNRLGNETSLYLRQHADNPVHWQPWDEKALAQARESDRPILLSVGYSACHWCHVMAHESFEDEATAELMNRYFINIKIDREERPDLDKTYQLAHQLLTGRGGGWPLTVFLDPVDLVPFFAGTYFPLERRYGMPAFREVLQALQQWFDENRDEIRKQNGKLSEAIASIQAPGGQSEDLLDPEAAQEVLRAAAGQFYARYDSANGGFGGAPKFPQAPLLEAVAMLSTIESGDSLHLALRSTLEKMALGGLRDHLDGGFFRYCVDGGWVIPHFEKMLYDNAMLLPLYAEAASAEPEALFEDAASGIVQWLEADMRRPGGACAASIDADADGEEGGFHVWNRDEVEALLKGEQLKLFNRVYGLDGPPNFEATAWHLQRRLPPARDGVDEALLADARAVLLSARDARVPPTRDNKILTAWNALLASGLIRAGRALEQPAWIDWAGEIVRFIRDECWTGQGLFAVHNAGQARFNAYLDDYAFLLDALLLHLQTRWERDLLDFAIALADTLLERFEDSANGGFYFNDADVAVPVGRNMPFQDDATPSGNAFAIRALNRLGRLLGEPRYSRAADRALARALPSLRENPQAYPSLLAALREAAIPPTHVIVAGLDAEAADWKKWVDSHYRVDCYLLSPPDETLPGVLAEYRPDDRVTAWVCQGMQCLPPAGSRDALAAILDSGPFDGDGQAGGAA